MTDLAKDRIALIVAESVGMGAENAGIRHGVSKRTVRRYRAQLEKDPELAELVRRKLRVLEKEWAGDAAEFMRSCLKRLKELIQKAGPEQIHDVAGALKIAGELLVMREAVGVEHAEPDGQGEEDPEAQGESGASTVH